MTASPSVETNPPIETIATTATPHHDEPVFQWTLFLLILALLAVSFAAIFIRWSSVELGAGATVFNRLWIATIVLMAWEGLKVGQSRENPTPPSIRLQDYGWLLLVGAVSSTSVVLWALSLSETSVANSTVLRNLTPLFTSLGAWLVFRQRFDRRFLLGLFVAICGAIAIGVGDFQLAWHNLTGDILALLSALCYGINLLLVENLRRRLGASQILLWRCGFGCTLLLPYVLLTETQIFPESAMVWEAVIALAVLCQCFGQGLVVHSLKTFSSGFVAIFLLLEPVVTATLAWLLLGETLSLANGVAFGGVLTGIYLAKSSCLMKPEPQPEKVYESSPAT
ncbi:MAG: DMT family transporter [Limnothrix sp. RL_2_0]|nr:DMT family transporter [Limnothrix sp. RL_2_0]